MFRQGEQYDIAQCNNAYVFPGLGLGILACHARRVTEEMLMAASRSGRAVAAGDNRKGGLLPPVDHIETVSRHIAFAVARAAIEQGVAPAMEDEMLLARIEETRWQADYAPYRRAAL